ncbi:hypothetical protein CH251_26810 [Rhodococcus sp. 06-462-5]|uniref:DUF202 domain-containing protein n=1 Tax=unclassified Rhodococcus (in: high G+C Gram-positive bacteria) TaxID=192944 RepID=UPI000B9C1B11|nr:MULTISPECIES: DUF202 domain-containing protein [unclassified Rhodococcus (in: high G+C Gram-positive bacteria)]OZC63800.1 hypothetical protein CH251_26810 [Rhodococcus sp. 06-462-5]OZE61555.1 hypothetical protein CH270_20935 [Rhodococcus sp. 02-925g]
MTIWRGGRERPDRRPGGELGDGGLQVERTELAWARTESAVAVCAVIGIRLSAHTRQPALVMLAVLVSFGAAALLLSGWIERMRAARASGSKSTVPLSFPFRAHVFAVMIPALGVIALTFVLWSAHITVR